MAKKRPIRGAATSVSGVLYDLDKILEAVRKNGKIEVGISILGATLVKIEIPVNGEKVDQVTTSEVKAKISGIIEKATVKPTAYLKGVDWEDLGRLIQVVIRSRDFHGFASMLIAKLSTQLASGNMLHTLLNEAIKPAILKKLERRKPIHSPLTDI
jgi:hypothetical protein